jgi:argininosuccinate lyase
MSGLMMSLKSLPLTYNKDMAEDKEPMFDCTRTVQDVIQIMEGVITTLTVGQNVVTTLTPQIKPDRMRSALTMDMLATDLADYLVRKGVSSLVSTSLMPGSFPRDASHIWTCSSKSRRNRGPAFRPFV